MTEQASARFDESASTYDRRSGIPDDLCRDIAGVIVELGEVAAGETLLELGAGSGQIGAWFRESAVRYVGLDASEAMLELFRGRLGGAIERIELVACDVNAPWPVPDGGVRCVFSSRAIHLFDVDHVIREVRRVASPTGAAFVLGRVERDPDSVREVLRRRMRSTLKEHGLASPDGGKRQRDAVDLASAAGGEGLAPVVAARWTIEQSAADVLRDWREKQGLGGATVPTDLKEEILDDLAGWAASEYGSLEAPQRTERAYVLRGVRLSA